MYSAEIPTKRTHRKFTFLHRKERVKIACLGNYDLLTLGLSSLFYIKEACSQSKVDCSNAITQVEINNCAQKQFLIADKELNDIYKKVMPKLDSKQKLVLIQSQRKWLAFREEYSKIYSLIYAGGSMSLSAVLKCKVEATRSRVDELRKLFDQVDL